MKKVFSLFCCFMMAVSLFAVPALSEWRNYVTTDGKTVRLILVGDEDGNWLQDADGLTYQLIDNQTVRMTSVTVAERRQMRRHSLVQRRAAQSEMPGKPRRGFGSINLAPRGLVILVNFADVTFQSSNTRSEMNQMMNGTSYTYGNTYGSVREYFRAQSGGAYVPTFDVVGPVTVKKNCSYYGENDSNGKDKFAGDMVVEACKAADAAGTDFTLYDNDGDGFIDFVYIIYAGKGAADGGEESTIWPHNWNVYSAYYYGKCTYNYWNDCKVDGLYIDSYACSGELNGRTDKRNSIGTITHEFGHVLGLPDHYDTKYGLNNDEYRTPGDWDIMASGSYNGFDDEGNARCGTCPPNYSAWEKSYFGWLNLSNPGSSTTNLTLNYNGATKYNAYQINASGTLQSVTTEGVNYYIENRQLIGWDKDLPGNGMIVWYVDFDEDEWVSNTLNATDGKPRLTLITARGIEKWIGTARDPFPGSLGVTSVSMANRSLTNITEQNNIVTCHYGKQSDTEPVSDDFCLQSENERSVFFTRPTTWDEHINVYMWVNGTETALVGTWPGSAAEQVGTRTYRFRVPPTVTQDMSTWMIIWNDGANQTGDLTYVNHAHYSGATNNTIAAGTEITTVCTTDKNIFTCANVNTIYDVVVGSLNPVTVAYVSAPYNYVYDQTGMTLVYGSQTWQVGQTVEGMQGKTKLFQQTPEFIPTNAASNWTVTNGVVPTFTNLFTAPTAEDINQIYTFRDVTFATELTFTTSTSSSGNMTINDENIQLFNQFRIAQTFKTGTKYNITGAVGRYYDVLQIYPIQVEEVLPETIYIDIDNAKYLDYVATEGWWQIAGYINEANTQYVSVSPSNVTRIAGTYDMSEMDAEYTGIYYYDSSTKEWVLSAFQSGTFTLFFDEEGIAHLTGTAVGADNNIYVLNINQERPDYPTPAYLAKHYDGSTNVVMAIRFEGEVCNDICIVGSYPANQWSTDVSTMVRMTPLTAYPGWYAAQIPATDKDGNAVYAKPVQLMNDGSFSWLYQTGDSLSWSYKDGSKATITAGYNNEADILWPQAGYYVYESKYFKKHKSPCHASVRNYVVFAGMPQACTEDLAPHITGDFNNWAEPGLLMNPMPDGEGNTVYVAEVTAIEDTEFRLSGGNSTTGLIIYNNAVIGNKSFPFFADTINGSVIVNPVDNTGFVGYDLSNAVYSGCLNYVDPATIATIPYSCSFDTEEEIEKWQFVNDTINQWVISDTAYYSSPNSLYITDSVKVWNYNKNRTQTSYAYVNLHFEEGFYSVRFNYYVYGERNYDYLTAYLMPIDGTQFTPGSITIHTSSIKLLDNVAEVSGNYFNEDVEITEAGNYRLVFMWHNDGSFTNGSPALIDDITIEEVRCRRPYNFQVADVTTTEALFGWNAHTDADKYELTVDDKTYITKDIVYVVENLKPGTYYTGYVRAICGADTSQAVSTSFSTACPTSYSLPYSNGFEASEAGANPLCWTVHETYDASVSVYNGASWAYNSQQFMLIQRSGNNTDTVLAVMPAFNEALDNIRLRFHYRTYRENVTFARVVVGYMTDADKPSTFVPYDTLPCISNYTDVPTQILFDQAPQNGYIAFTLTTDNSEYSEYYIDDIVVDRIPSCYEPSELAVANLSTSSATITWKSDASIFTIYYSDGEQVLTKVATTNAVDLTDLETNKQYTVYVMAMCGFGQMSEASVPLVFRTGSQHSGSKSGHDYIDLGLTSGTLWATANVSATAPEQIGNYYAWGEIATKDTYTEENSLTYKRDDYNFDIAGNPSLDAATAAWGEQWRMPTAEQMSELIDETEWAYLRLNGMAGYQIIGPNGNSIFLPIGGTMENDQLTVVGYLYYFSTTPSATTTTTAYAMDVRSITAKKVRGLNRWYGLPVRPVVAPQNTQPTDNQSVAVGSDQPRKIVRDGILYILRSNEWYDATGRKLK